MNSAAATVTSYPLLAHTLATMASTKKLSNGTLSLRFMQNAQRAKQQEQSAEAEHAKVHDDGAWEISKDIRDAWGIDNQPAGCQSFL